MEGEVQQLMEMVRVNKEFVSSIVAANVSVELQDADRIFCSCI